MKAVKRKRKSSAEAVISEHRPILSAMLAPKSIALIGASEKPGSAGRALLENLQPFRGHVFPINPNHARLLGQKTFPTIKAAMEDVAEPADGGQLLQTKSRPDRREGDRRSWATQPIEAIGCPSGAMLIQISKKMANTIWFLRDSSE